MNVRVLCRLAAAVSMLCSCSREQNVMVGVVPYPQEVDVTDRDIDIDRFRRVEYSPGLENEAAFLKGALASSHPMDGSSGKAIELVISASGQPSGAYCLDVSGSKITITGEDNAGVFYGIQTLLHEIWCKGVKKGTIRDYPRYGWRGFMLDEARHFFGKETVKRLLDMMAYYKLNRFHWHLTDAQGWRIEIRGYPLLAGVGGIGCHSDPDTPAAFYTQEDIREIVEYAAARHIEVIPEIDMPGHASAANRAYPEFNGGGTEQFPDFTFNVGKEGTYAYLTGILREVAQLFPSEYIHIGGDEVFYGSEAWKRDPDVRKLMAREGFSTVSEAEGYFIRRMADSLKTLGKTLIGWDDILDFRTDPERSVICWWRHDRPESLRKSLSGGYTTILCPRKPLYFDFVQADRDSVGRRWDGFCPLEDVYAFPDAWYAGWNLTEADMSHVIGMQANLWTELVHNADRLGYMIFPRICALAEAAWTLPENKDYQDFSERMNAEYPRLHDEGLYYFDARRPDYHKEPAGPEIKKRGAAKISSRN